MYSRNHRKVKLLLALADVLLAALAFEAAYQSRVLLPLANLFFLSIRTKVLLLGVAAILWPLLGYWLGAYERLDAAHPRVVLRDSLKQSAYGAIGMVLVDYLGKFDLSRAFLGLFTVYSWVLLCLFRWNAATLVGWIRKEFGAPHYVLVAGIGARAQRLGRSLERSAAHGIRLVGFLADHAGETETSMRLERDYVVYPLAQLPSLLERNVIDEILFAVDSRRLAELEEVMLICDEVGVRTRVAVDFFPHVNSEVYLDRLEKLPLLTFAAAPHDEILLFLKRVIDVALASAALVLVSPLMLLIGLLIRLSSPGAVIFRQVRCGLNGRRFEFFKFRSMVMNAEEMKESLRHMSSREVVFKIPDDPRLTWIGRYIRRFSIDEWPQLWNVIKGDMSLVGPRPAVPEEVEQYKRWQRRRLRMRPGLTCLWALDGRDTLDFETWMRKDMEYIDNWSLALDWKIMLRTIPRVLSGQGAH
ncbi:MAG: sugar transferase [Acidobacteriia bacterium]|nr:sugar transferase [Terriglobia bacterium]